LKSFNELAHVDGVPQDRLTRAYQRTGFRWCLRSSPSFHLDRFMPFIVNSLLCVWVHQLRINRLTVNSIRFTDNNSSNGYPAHWLSFRTTTLIHLKRLDFGRFDSIWFTENRPGSNHSCI